MSSTHEAQPTRTIAIVIGSTRGTRLGPHVASLVQETLKKSSLDALRDNNNSTTSNDGINSTTTTSSPSSPPITFSLLDLTTHPLPLFDEPTLPASHDPANPTPHYSLPHTRAWSETIGSFSAFIFLTPQYNWSIPAGLKNALDYLYHEWKGKPAGVISYGGHGGGKAAGHLRDVLSGLRMRVAETGVEVKISKEVFGSFAQTGGGEGFDSEALRRDWREADGEERLERMVGEILEGLRGGDL